MCLIAVSDKSGQFLTPDEIANSRANNRDGVGIMHLSHGRVVIRKSLGDLPAPTTVRGQYAMHWRYATGGSVSRKGAHPHMVVSKDWGDPYDLALMHNGVFHWLDDPEGVLSDTMLWVRDVLRPMLREEPFSILDESSQFWEEVRTAAEESGSRVLLCGTPIGFVAAPELPKWSRSPSGAYISNTYSIEPPYAPMISKSGRVWLRTYEAQWTHEDDWKLDGKPKEWALGGWSNTLEID